jgi:hypothetical protein
MIAVRDPSASSFLAALMPPDESQSLQSVSEDNELQVWQVADDCLGLSDDERAGAGTERNQHTMET